jgi:hypothetical protein
MIKDYPNLARLAEPESEAPVEEAMDASEPAEMVEMSTGGGD